MSRSRAVPDLSRIGVRSTATVMCLSPRLICRQTFSSTRIVVTSSKQPGVDQYRSASSEYRGVGGARGVVCDPETGRDLRDRQVPDELLKAHPARSGRLRPPFRGTNRTLPPDPPHRKHRHQRSRLENPARLSRTVLA